MIELKTGDVLREDVEALVNTVNCVGFMGPTKRHWRSKSRIEDIEAGLETLVSVILEQRIRSIAIPPLGTGLGGLEWADVCPRIERALLPLADVRVVLFKPQAGPPPNPGSLWKRAHVPGNKPIAVLTVIMWLACEMAS